MAMHATPSSFFCQSLPSGKMLASMQTCIMFWGQAFGGPLVVRKAGAGPTYLTEAGQALLPLCSGMLAVAGEAVRALADLRAAHSGRVALAASQTVGTYIMPRLLAAFRARNPGVTVTLQVDQSRRACDAVARGEADCAIIGGDVPEELTSMLQVLPSPL
jgi:DNA-binding transcriptional LysR family regulator